MLLAIKIIEKIPDPRMLKNTIIQTNTFKNLNIVDIKSIITEHPKTSHKVSKTISQAEKVIF